METLLKLKEEIKSAKDNVARDEDRVRTRFEDLDKLSQQTMENGAATARREMELDKLTEHLALEEEKLTEKENKFRLQEEKVTGC